MIWFFRADLWAGRRHVPDLLPGIYPSIHRRLFSALCNESSREEKREAFDAPTEPTEYRSSFGWTLVNSSGCGINGRGNCCWISSYTAIHSMASHCPVSNVSLVVEGKVPVGRGVSCFPRILRSSKPALANKLFTRESEHKVIILNRDTPPMFSLSLDLNSISRRKILSG